MTVTKSSCLAEVKAVYKRKLTSDQMKKITTSGDAYRLLYPVFENEQLDHHETFVVMFINRANKCLGWAKISQGGIASTIVDAKIIFQLALKVNASGIILVHNHPSLSIKPSESDVKLTNKLKEGGKLLDIEILDHLIISSEKGKYFSFADESKL